MSIHDYLCELYFQIRRQDEEPKVIVMHPKAHDELFHVALFPTSAAGAWRGIPIRRSADVEIDKPEMY